MENGVREDLKFFAVLSSGHIVSIKIIRFWKSNLDLIWPLQPQTSSFLSLGKRCGESQLNWPARSGLLLEATECKNWNLLTLQEVCERSDELGQSPETLFVTTLEPGDGAQVMRCAPANLGCVFCIQQDGT